MADGRAIMVQGTASHVGKSLVATALCRVFSRRGIKVAPFKAQNMSNNSYVPRGGGEIGWAQAVQAEAAGVEPSGQMNPLLLKPTAGKGFQVVCFGKSLGNFTSRQYSRRLPALWKRVRQAAFDIRAGNDVLVVEGMGSPVEINMKREDIANMALARALRAPTILVGDIDLGGVFAQLVGTFELFTAAERRMVQGIIINKMSGDPGMLRRGIRSIERRTGVPVLGVLPYVRDLGFPEEDQPPVVDAHVRRPGARRLRVEVFRLPGISNFMDADGLRGEPDVDLRFVDAPQPGRPEVIILLGSKSTIAGLDYMRSRKLDDYLHRSIAAGTHVVGICGGYQMLGVEVRDRTGAESPVKRARGLGVLPVVTAFSPRKITTRVWTVHRASGLAAGGYEIHMGRTESPAGRAVFSVTENGRSHWDGCSAHRGRVWGTYVHGVFDSAPFRRWFLDGVREHFRMKRIAKVGSEEHVRRQRVYDRVADMAERHLDMKRIMAMVGR